MRRRQFLKIAGGSAALTGGAGCVYAAPTAKSARAAWESAGAYTDPMRFALSYAILAPNPHNRQPWQIELKSEHEAILYCDPERHLPDTDPFDRQITIGLGCFLEVFALAAAHKGYSAQFEYFPQGASMPLLDARPVARLLLKPDTAANPDLFPYIPFRKTDRSPYSNRVPAIQDLESVQRAGGIMANVSSEKNTVQTLKPICIAALRTEFGTPHTYQESVDLMRIGRAQVRRNPDGISIEGPMVELLKIGGVLSKKALQNPQSTAFRQGLQIGLDGIENSPAFVWIISPDNTRTDQIASGRAYVRANLQASALGLSMQPLSQALQEYSEMAPHYQAIYEALGIKTPNCLQMLARIGYGQKKGRAPRWPLDTRIYPYAE
ncbi:MAG: twin-arginine translocation pathway signal protein [Robiginitomaculum sp.]|nr:MAG: twin-arginine translocation pathway signal protein [Robiginitomaculum sp.]